VSPEADAGAALPVSSGRCIRPFETGERPVGRAGGRRWRAAAVPLAGVLRGRCAGRSRWRERCTTRAGNRGAETQSRPLKRRFPPRLGKPTAARTKAVYVAIALRRRCGRSSSCHPSVIDPSHSMGTMVPAPPARRRPAALHQAAGRPFNVPSRRQEETCRTSLSTEGRS